jgi:hypothetical protein
MMNCTLRLRGMSEYAVCGWRLPRHGAGCNAKPFVMARREFLNANFSEQREFSRT